jgi:hypothetical protein
MTSTTDVITINGPDLTPYATKANPTLTGTVSTSGQFQSTKANDAGDGQGQIYLNGATGNRIDFNANGQAIPATGTRSAGTKIVLAPNIAAAGSCDFAIGTDSPNGVLWNSTAFWTDVFRWYGGNYLAATLTGQGHLTLNASTGGLTTPTVSTTGNVTVGGNLTVTGTLPARYHIIGTVNGTAVTPTYTDQGGKYTATIVRRPGNNAGVYQITYSTAHTRGSNYTALLTSIGPVITTVWNGIAQPQNSTIINVACYALSAGSFVLTDSNFNIAIPL